MTKPRSQVFPADAKLLRVESLLSNSKVVSLVHRQLLTHSRAIVSRFVAQIDAHVSQCADNLAIDLSRHDLPSCDCAAINSGRFCGGKIGVKDRSERRECRQNSRRQGNESNVDDNDGNDEEILYIAGEDDDDFIDMTTSDRSGEISPRTSTPSPVRQVGTQRQGRLKPQTV